MERPDLDGIFVDTGQGKNAIIINGLCRILHNSLVERSLFGINVNINPVIVDNIKYGSDINDGSCLIKGDGMHEIFLLTGFPHTVRQLISNYETFQKLNFDISEVRIIPWLALQSIPVGPTIIARIT